MRVWNGCCRSMSGSTPKDLKDTKVMRAVDSVAGADTVTSVLLWLLIDISFSICEESLCWVEGRDEVKHEGERARASVFAESVRRKTQCLKHQI